MTQLFDPNRADQRRRRALAAAKPGADFLLSEAIAELRERLAVVQRTFTRGVDLLTPLPTLAGALADTGQIGDIVRFDRLATTPSAVPLAIADAEAIPLGFESVDLIVSALGLQQTNDLPGALAQIKFALRPDGLFLAVLLGGDTLTELRQALTEAEVDARGGATPRIAPFASVRDLGALLQRVGFALPVADQDRVTVRYDDVLALMRDLRAMGATNVLTESDRRPLTRGIIDRAGEIYTERFAETDGRIPATFDFVWLSGWAPHESQQKPLRQGSAKARLAEALGAVERPAGDKADPGDS
jgi:SAM-dependent methyltransferase